MIVLKKWIEDNVLNPQCPNCKYNFFDNFVHSSVVQINNNANNNQQNNNNQNNNVQNNNDNDGNNNAQINIIHQNNNNLRSSLSEQLRMQTNDNS
jgi:hypothetical protein